MFAGQAAGPDIADERVDEAQVGPLGSIISADDSRPVALRQQSRTQAPCKAFDAINPIGVVQARVVERLRQNCLGLGGDFYTLSITDSTAKMAENLGDLADSLHAVIDDHYENGLY